MRNCVTKVEIKNAKMKANSSLVKVVLKNRMRDRERERERESFYTTKKGEAKNEYFNCWWNLLPFIRLPLSLSHSERGWNILWQVSVMSNEGIEKKRREKGTKWERRKQAEALTLKGQERQLNDWANKVVTHCRICHVSVSLSLSLSVRVLFLPFTIHLTK